MNRCALSAIYLSNLQGLEIATANYSSKWYNLNEAQKVYIRLMMVRAQRPLIFHGYHFFECNLFTYTEVNTLCLSVCWMVRQFGYVAGGQNSCVHGHGVHQNAECVNELLITPEENTHSSYENNIVDLN